MNLISLNVKKLTKFSVKLLCLLFFITYFVGDIYTTIEGYIKYNEANNVAKYFLHYGVAGFIILKVLGVIVLSSIFIALTKFGYRRTGIYLFAISSFAGLLVCFNNLFYFLSYHTFSLIVFCCSALIPLIAFFDFLELKMSGHKI